MAWKFRFLKRFVLSAGTLGVLTACGGSTREAGGSPDATVPAQACVPGQQVACACAGGGTAAQVCNAEGTAYGVCSGCGDAGAGGADAAVSMTGFDGGPGNATDGGQPVEAGSDGDAAADAGTCATGTTTLTGTVYDPAGENPVYDVVVYVPAGPLAPLARGVETGAAACSCGALFPEALAVTTTDVQGRFTLTNVPVGGAVPIVIQTGKWRRQITTAVTACSSNTVAGKLTLPGSVPAGDTDTSMPDIAVSTGGADSLECTLARIGIAASEYVAGGSSAGHVHIFLGGDAAKGTGELNPMTGAPQSSTALWDSPADLLKNDLVLFSCEGAETANAVPANLETYLNEGGRALASHFHYAWFAGSVSQGYSAPSDWGANLAAWNLGDDVDTSVDGIVETTFTNSTAPFAKGLAFKQWLSDVGALDAGASSNELPIAEPRYNASVTTQTASQSWLQADPSTGTSSTNGPTLQFSFDTPVASNAACGRAVFSEIHAGAAAYDGVNCPANSSDGGGGTAVCTGHVAAAPPPAGCDTAHPLSPQEEALEFTLFDLTSCPLVFAPPPPADAGLP